MGVRFFAFLLEDIWIIYIYDILEPDVRDPFWEEA